MSSSALFLRLWICLNNRCHKRADLVNSHSVNAIDLSLCPSQWKTIHPLSMVPPSPTIHSEGLLLLLGIQLNQTESSSLSRIHSIVLD